MTNARRPLTPADERHGTYAGWNAHQRYKVPVCAACRRAATEYRREWRRVRLRLQGEAS